MAHMMRQIGELIEDEKYVSLVEQLELAADLYSRKSVEKPQNILVYKEAFCRLLAEYCNRCGISGIRLSAGLFDDELSIDRNVLSKLEKNIVSATMYQKHLWEFMGTTSIMTAVTKNTLSQDGFSYSDFLPCRFSVEDENFLRPSDEDGQIFYFYSDGSVSQKFDRQKAICSFNRLTDDSGFDWKMKGWNPDYQLTSSLWHGGFNSSSIWCCVPGAARNQYNAEPSCVEENIYDLEILRCNDRYILCDFHNMLLFLLADEKFDKIRFHNYLKELLNENGVEKISALCVKEPEECGHERNNSSVTGSTSWSDPSQTASLLSVKFPDLFTQQVQLLSLHSVVQLKKYIHSRRQSLQKNHFVRQAALTTASQILFARRNGCIKKLPELAETGRTSRLLTFRNPEDAALLPLDPERKKNLLSLELPEARTMDFDRCLFNLCTFKELLDFSDVDFPSCVDLLKEHFSKDNHERSRNITFHISLAQLFSMNKLPSFCSSSCAAARNFSEQVNALKCRMSLEQQNVFSVAAGNLLSVYTFVFQAAGMTCEELLACCLKFCRNQSDVMLGRILHVEMPLHKFFEGLKKSPPAAKTVVWHPHSCTECDLDIFEPEQMETFCARYLSDLQPSDIRSVKAFVKKQKTIALQARSYAIQMPFDKTEEFFVRRINLSPLLFGTKHFSSSETDPMAGVSNCRPVTGSTSNNSIPDNVTDTFDHQKGTFLCSTTSVNKVTSDVFSLPQKNYNAPQSMENCPAAKSVSSQNNPASPSHSSTESLPVISDSYSVTPASSEPDIGTEDQLYSSLCRQFSSVIEQLADGSESMYGLEKNIASFSSRLSSLDSFERNRLFARLQCSIEQQLQQSFISLSHEKISEVYRLFSALQDHVS